MHSNSAVIYLHLSEHRLLSLERGRWQSYETSSLVWSSGCLGNNPLHVFPSSCPFGKIIFIFKEYSFIHATHSFRASVLCPPCACVCVCMVMFVCVHVHTCACVCVCMDRLESLSSSVWASSLRTWEDRLHRALQLPLNSQGSFCFIFVFLSLLTFLYYYYLSLTLLL